MPATSFSTRKDSCAHPAPRKAAKPNEDEAKDTQKEAVKATSAAGNRWRAIDPPHAAPQPAYQRPAPQPAAAPAAKPAPTPALNPSPVNRKLTKAERKALKERLLRERQDTGKPTNGEWHGNADC